MGLNVSDTLREFTSEQVVGGSVLLMADPVCSPNYLKIVFTLPEMNMLSTFRLRNRGRVTIRRAYLGLRVMSKSRLPDKIRRTSANFIDMSNNLKEVVCIYPSKIFPTVLVSTVMK